MSKISVNNALGRDASGATRLEEAKDIDSDLRWRLLVYSRECDGMINVGRFCAVAIDDTNLVMYDGSIFQYDTALGAWKQHWAVLRN